jgi:hypothetical protein
MLYETFLVLALIVFFSLAAVLRLFRIILDINNPDFRVDDRQWRPNAIDIFSYYFSAAWADQRVGIVIYCKSLFIHLLALGRDQACS